jgi:hypothetical protein
VNKTEGSPNSTDSLSYSWETLSRPGCSPDKDALTGSKLEEPRNSMEPLVNTGQVQGSLPSQIVMLPEKEDRHSISPRQESPPKSAEIKLEDTSMYPVRADPHYQHLFGKRRTLPAERAKKTKVSKRSGPLKAHQRKNAAKMRQINRCLRCRLYKLGVSPSLRVRKMLTCLV